MPTKKLRHTCCKCGMKRTEDVMKPYVVYSSRRGAYYWHCIKCPNTAVVGHRK